MVCSPKLLKEDDSESETEANSSAAFTGWGL